MEFNITQEIKIIRTTYIEAESFEQACEIFSNTAHEYPKDDNTVNYFATDEHGDEYSLTSTR